MVGVGIVGASGYTSSELMRLLIQHPGGFELTLVTSETYTGQRVDRVLPNLRGLVDLYFEKLEIEKLKDRVNVVVLAVPHKVAMDFVPRILDQDLRVVDFSADYRLNEAEVYEEWYQVEHTDAERMTKAVYGIPEQYKDRIPSAQLVANPGCYPTGSILALAPLVKTHLIDNKSIIIDSKSGISGAGSKAKEVTHYPNRESNSTAYGLVTHRHTPEIEQELSAIAGETVMVNFTPHLVPMTRGILTTTYANLAVSTTTADILDHYCCTYAEEPFVQVLDIGEYPQTKAVLGSNFCHVGLEVDPRTNRVIVISTIDNLVKGAAGAVVQNLNLMYGLTETAGLMSPGLMP